MIFLNTMKKDIYKFNSEEHAHTLNGVALTGTSSIGNVLAKGGLTWWASGKACEVMGWSNPKKFTEEERLKTVYTVFNEVRELPTIDYLALLDTAYKAHATQLKESAKSGTDLHEVLERFVKMEMGREVEPLTIEEIELIQPFIDWSKENVKKFIASEAHCYSKELWVGGIVDAVAELNDGTLAVIDFKSAKAVYITHYIQTSGYAIEIDENGLFSSDGEHQMKLDKKIGALIVVPFGAEVIKPEIRKQISQYEAGFKSAVELYRLLDLDKLIAGQK